jgi:hypothetical protein
VSTLRALKKLVLGETWLLPLGLAAVILVAELLAHRLTPDAWAHAGGFILLAGVLAVLVVSVARTAGHATSGPARARRRRGRR